MPEEIKKEHFTIKHLSQMSLWLALVMLLVMSLVLMFYQSRLKTQNSQGSKNNFLDNSRNLSSGVTELSAKAFGSLSLADNKVGSMGQAKYSGQAVAVGNRTTMGGSGLMMVESNAMMVEPMEPKIGLPYIPDMPSFNYVYEGETFSLKDEQQPVFRRVKGSGNFPKLGEFVSRFDIGLIDWSKFQEAELNSLSLSQNRDFGYNLEVNFIESTLNLSQNWQKWPHPEQNCRNEDCFRKTRPQIEDVLSDNQVLAIAISFFKDMGIDSSFYGEPEIQNLWREDYDKAENKTDYYIPEEASALFPLKIKGQSAFEMFGEKAGLVISVNYKNQKVSGMYSLTNQVYEESKYEAVIDVEKVMTKLLQGGFQNFWGGEGVPATGNKIDIKLGTPALALVRYYNFNEKTAISEEIFGPSLVFPVNNYVEVKNNFYRKNIIIPLVKEIFDKENNFPDIGPVLLNSASGASAPGSSGNLSTITNEEPSISPETDPDQSINSSNSASEPGNIENGEIAPSPM